MAAPAQGSPASGTGGQQQQQQRPVQVKLVLLGEAAVGKSSVVLRFVQNDFQENKEPTIGAAFLTQKCRLEDKVIKFEIWDTAGQERFHSLAPMYYRNAQAAVVAYDVTKGPSLDKAKSWVKELQRQANPNIVIALIGNKIDLLTSDSSASSGHEDDEDAPAAKDASAADDDEADDTTATPEAASSSSANPTTSKASSSSKRQVSREEAEAYAQEAGLLFFETSAKTGEGVVEVFTEIAKKIPLEHILSSTGARPNAAGAAGGNRTASGTTAGAAGGGGGRVRLGARGGGAGGESEGAQGKDGCAC